MTRHTACKHGTNRHRISSNGRAGTVPLFQHCGQPWPERCRVDVRVATNLRESRQGGRDHHKIGERGQSPTSFNGRKGCASGFCVWCGWSPRFLAPRVISTLWGRRSADPSHPVDTSGSEDRLTPRDTIRGRVGPIELRHHPTCHLPELASRERIGRVAYQGQDIDCSATGTASGQSR